MEWEKASSNSSNGSSGNNNGGREGGPEEGRRGGGGGGGEGDGVLYVKVMTEEQMEVLRRQIAAYATICEQLVEMHKAVTAHHDSLAGMRLGSIYCDPLMTSGGHKITARQRWTPTPVQLQILESIFDKGNGTPSKHRIKEITSDLSQHGQISESNVYNWFQNRRARSKRKQTTAVQNNIDSEVEAEAEAEAESSNEKKAKSEKIRSNESLHPGVDDQSFQSADNSSEMHFLDPDSIRTHGNYAPHESSRSSVSLGRMSFYENALSNSSAHRVDHFMGRMEFPGSFNHLRPEESYDMIG